MDYTLSTRARESTCIRRLARKMKYLNSGRCCKTHINKITRAA